MKIEDLTRPPLLTVGVVGVVGLAAVAAAGFALGMAVGRDPEAARRRVRAVVGEAARAFEQAALLAAQARERAGDLWAEARAQAVSEVDERDFARAAAAAPGAGAAVAAADSGPEPGPTKSKMRQASTKQPHTKERARAGKTAGRSSSAPST